MNFPFSVSIFIKTSQGALIWEDLYLINRKYLVGHCDHFTKNKSIKLVEKEVIIVIVAINIVCNNHTKLAKLWYDIAIFYEKWYIVGCIIMKAHWFWFCLGSLKDHSPSRNTEHQEKSMSLAH